MTTIAIDGPAAAGKGTLSRLIADAYGFHHLDTGLTYRAVAKALLVGSILLVLIVELLNSGIEAVTDRVSLEDHALAKRAKDLGSAAVMLSLVNVPLVWLLTLVG